MYYEGVGGGGDYQGRRSIENFSKFSKTTDVMVTVRKSSSKYWNSDRSKGRSQMTSVEKLVGGGWMSQQNIQL